MAEARLGTDPLPPLSLYTEIDPTVRRIQAAMTRDGFSLFIPHPRYILRNIVKFVKRLHNKVQQVFVPVPLPVVLTMTAGALTWLLGSKSNSSIRQSRLAWFLWNIDSKLPWARYLNNEVRVAYLTFDASVLILGGFTFFHRMLLRLLLSYTGWIDEGRGKKSTMTKVWGFLLKYVYMRDPHRLMLAHQTSLPALPLPSPKDTVARYLKSMEPILSEEEMAELRKQGGDFLKNDAPRLQRFLWLKRAWASNWITDWWLDYVYLRPRDSIMINSNYYGLTLSCKNPTNNQAARAASVIYHLVHEKLEIDHERFPAMVIQGVVPICMDQYTRAFSVTREPHAVQDRLRKYDSSESRHVVVRYRGHFFKVRCFCDVTGRPLSRLQLQAAIARILETTKPLMNVLKPHQRSEGATTNTSSPSGSFDGSAQLPPPETHIAALTALKRDHWASIRDTEFLRDRVNRTALDTIERALFFVCLDEAKDDPWDIAANGHSFLHGSGSDRWFDKSFNVVVTANGYVGINGEHSWGDAPAIAHLLELYLAREMREASKVFDPATGAIIPTPAEQRYLDAGTLRVYHGERILFNISANLGAEIDEARQWAEKEAAKVDICSEEFLPFGKNAIKKAKCSPDAFVQMAIQLAYFRLHHKFTQTYESAMTRLYSEGRTETIRSCTNEAAAFCRAMMNPDTTADERKRLLWAACEQHVRLSAMAMTGRGVDRHLFGLYVVWSGTTKQNEKTEVPPFLKNVFGRGWKLSTSQIPQNQTINEWAVKDPGDRYAIAAGGFGPVADDGYGVCYCISGEQSLFFHCTAKNTCEHTSAKRMQTAIQESLLDMIRIFPDIELEPKKPAQFW